MSTPQELKQFFHLTDDEALLVHKQCAGIDATQSDHIVIVASFTGVDSFEKMIDWACLMTSIFRGSGVKTDVVEAKLIPSVEFPEALVTMLVIHLRIYYPKMNRGN